MDDQMIARVREVIATAGLTQRAFAQAIGIDETKLTKSLRGKRRLTSLELALIAQIGDRTVEWLLTGENSRAMVFAHRSALLDNSVVEMVGEAALSVAAERFEALESIGMAPRHVDLPARPTGWSYVEGSNSLARTASSLLGAPVSSLSTDGLIDLVEETFGLDVVVTELPTECDGIAYQDGEFRAIVLATTDVAARQRHTLAHELGHILWGDAEQDIIRERVADTGNSIAEKRASVFAASFTVPADELRTEMDDRDPIDQFDHLVMKFRVSPSSMSWRLFNLGMISASQQSELSARTSAQCAAATDNVEEHLVRNRGSLQRRPPLRLAVAATLAYLQGETTVAPAAQLLGWSEEETRQMLSTSAADEGRLENPES